MVQTTHGVSMAAEMNAVWPWPVQMGYYRRGGYTERQWWDHLADTYPHALVRREVEATGQGHRDERWGGQDDYEAYKARTPVLVPPASAGHVRKGG